MSLGLQGVLFDLDGTLIDSSQGFCSALNQLLAAHGLPTLDKTELMQVPLGARDLLHYFLPVQAQADYAQLRQAFLAAFAQVVADEFELYPGVADALAYLQQQQTPWGIVTNKPLALTQATLSRLDWQPRVVLCPEQVPAVKPCGSGILLACQRLGLAGHQVAYVGDNEIDVLAARHAGSYAIATGWGHRPSHSNPADWRPDRIFTHSASLMHSLKELFA